MSRTNQQRGFAIALLLWMIAGMSLTVAAVIHFARSDVGIAELRVREAKAQAVGRGVARLLLRDSAMAVYAPDAQRERAEPQLPEDESRPDEQLFSKEYRFGRDWVVSGTLRPSNGFVSLNNADREELIMLFTELGKISKPDAIAMAEGVIVYRADFPGFRYPEELLAVPDSSRVAYDRVKSSVHTYRTGSLAAGNAPSRLAAVTGEQGNSSSASSNQQAPGNPSGRGQVEGRITFESIAEAIRNPDGAADLAINAAEIEVTLSEGAQLRQTVWVSNTGAKGVLRAGDVTVKKEQ